MNSEIPSLHRTRFYSLKSSRMLIIAAFAIALIGSGFAGYFYYQYQRNLPQNIAQRNQEEAKKLAQEVGKFMLLPTDETPTVATVTDISKLTNQDFFKFAKNGDKVLIFAKARMAILYNPNLHKIINVGPVNIGDQPNQAPQAKIALFNGTTIDGLAAKEQTDLQKSFPGTNIVKTGTANNTDYVKTIIVTLNPLAKNAAEMLAKFYNAKVTSLPSTESPQDGVDILVILGRDRGIISTPSASPASPSATIKK